MTHAFLSRQKCIPLTPPFLLNLLALSIFSLGATGCASAPQKNGDATSAEGSATIQTSSSNTSSSVQSEPILTTAPAPALTTEQLQQRVMDLEMRITALNDKLNLLSNGGSSAPAPKVIQELPTEVVKTPVASARNTGPTQIQLTEITDQYREAKILFDSKRFADSNLEFSEFVKNNPSHPLASMAQFYVGQSYFEQKEYKLAEEEWNRGMIAYSKSQAVRDYLEGLKKVAVLNQQNAKVEILDQKLKTLNGESKL